MESITDKYEDALFHIEQEEYEESLEKLNEILQHTPIHPQVKWTLGLVYASLGLPYKALDAWKNISDIDSDSVSSYRDRLITILPLYQSLIEVYNKGISLIRENELQKAMYLFDELISHQSEVPLPLDFYKTNLLLTIILQKTNPLLKVQAYPKYVLNHSSVSTILSDLKTFKENERRLKGKKLNIGIGIALLLFVGTIGTTIVLESNKSITSKESLNDKKSVVESYENDEIHLPEEKIFELSNRNTHLKDSNNQLTFDLKKLNNDLVEAKKTKSLLTA